MSFPGNTLVLKNDFFEFTYLEEIFRFLSSYSWFDGFRFLIVDHLTPDPGVDRNTIVIYLSNEDGRLPKYIDDCGLLFTPYIPKSQHSKAHAIPLGFNGNIPFQPVKSVLERNTEVFFSGRKIQRRKAAFDALDQLVDDQQVNCYLNKTSGFAGGLNSESYAKNLNNSKITIAPEGNFSNITFRHFEAARQGCILISASLPDTWFFRNFPGYQMEDWNNLPELVHSILQDKEFQVKLQKEVLDYYDKNWSPKAVASYMANIIQKNLMK